jgi:hypothetical protein
VRVRDLDDVAPPQADYAMLTDVRRHGRMLRRRRYATRGSILALGLLAVAGGVWATRPGGRVRPTVAVEPTTSVGPTSSACETVPMDTADFLAKVHQTGEVAYQSRPIDVTSTGSYVLVFGPLTPTDAVRFREATGGGVSFPTEKFQSDGSWSQITPVVINGETYLHLPMDIFKLTEPCTGLQAWVQF